jgi:tRNA (guanine37-N1)-methyltransferase
MINSAFSYGVLSRAIQQNIISINSVNIRDYAEDKHKMTDDYQYGGGQGLVMKPEPVCKAVFDIKNKCQTHVILLDPRGKKFDQAKAESLLQYNNITIICGRYEGIDERIRTLVVDEEISIGDFVLSGGEFASFCLVDAVARLIPGVLGDEMSPVDESFSTGLLEYPHYTRPAEYEGLKVPEVLTSGHHGEIEKWRKKESLKITLQHRPDLLSKINLNSDEKKLLNEIRIESEMNTNIYVALIHYPMLDKQKNIVATSITNMDLHDISRSCKTFGIAKYFIVTPLEAQKEIAERVLNHWTEGYGSTYNSNRKEAFKDTVIKSSLLEVINEIEKTHGKKPKLVATTAKKVKSNIDFDELKKISYKEPVLIMFGTGWGMTEDLFNMATYVLKPIEGPTDFNHLSVRSAVAIMLDRFHNS